MALEHYKASIRTAGGRRRGIEAQRFEEKAEEVDLEEVKAARERAAAALRAAHERAAARD